MLGAVQQFLSYVSGVRKKGVDKKPRVEIKLWTKKKQIEQKWFFQKKRVFLGKTTFTQWFIVLNRKKKNKYPSKANEIFENKWKMKINIRINTIKTNRIEVFTILTVLRFKLFADISRK